MTYKYIYMQLPIAHRLHNLKGEYLIYIHNIDMGGGVGIPVAWRTTSTDCPLGTTQVCVHACECRAMEEELKWVSCLPLFHTHFSSIWLASKKYLEYFLMYNFPLFTLYIHLHTATKWLIVWYCQSLHIQSVHWHKCACIVWPLCMHVCVYLCHPLQRYAPIKLCTLICSPTCEYDGPDQLMMYKYACNLTHQLLQLEQQMKVK